MKNILGTLSKWWTTAKRKIDVINFLLYTKGLFQVTKVLHHKGIKRDGIPDSRLTIFGL